MNRQDYTKLGKKLRRDINEKFGKQCREFDMGCVICNAHRVVDGVDSLADLLEALRKNKKMHTHKK